MNKKIRTDFLFAQPSFFAGTARVLDLWGQLDEYNVSESGAEADSNAIAADWCVVGQDLFDAMGQFESERRAA
jgi:hypothetical protein